MTILKGSKTFIYLSTTLATLIIAFVAFGSQASANVEEGILSDDQLNELNEALDSMKDEANEKFDNGETEFKLERELSYQDAPVELEFENNNDSDSEFSTMSSTRSANYTGTIRNQMGVANSFNHRLDIDWTYNSSNSTIMNVVPRAQLNGALYSRVENTTQNKLTNSVTQVNSRGSFRPYNIPAITYQTRFVINVNGTGSYSVVELYVGN